MASSNSDLSVALYTEDGLQLNEKRVMSRWCGLSSETGPDATVVVPWSHVLSAKANVLEEGKEGCESIQVTFAKSVSSKEHAEVEPITRTVLLPPSADSTEAQKTAQAITDRAYNRTQYRKRILAIVNPFSGKGKGSALRKYNKWIQPIFDAAECEVTVVKTTHRSHAVEVAKDLDIDKYDVVACCSGDGVPHEVFNGFSKRPDARKALAKLAVVQLPGGTGNAMSWNCFRTGTPSVAALKLVKGIRTPLDLVSITHPSRDNPAEIERTLSFLSQSVGVIAYCDLGTEHLRFLGESRFALGLIWKIVTKELYPCDIALEIETEDKEQIREHSKTQSELEVDQEEELRRVETAEPGLPPLKYGTIRDELPEGWEFKAFDTLGNFYCGNMIEMQNEAPFFPMALPADGLIDLVTIPNDIPTGPALQMLDDCPKNTLFDHPSVQYRKVRAYRLIPKNKDGFISIDGEAIPHAGYQAEVHQKLGTTLTLTGRVFEGPGIPQKPTP